MESATKVANRYAKENAYLSVQCDLKDKEIQRLRAAYKLEADANLEKDAVIAKLRAALEDMFAMIDEGLLVRHISNDASELYAMDMLKFVQRLAKAKQALEGE
jgi:hypothetical protein